MFLIRLVVSSLCIFGRKLMVFCVVLVLVVMCSIMFCGLCGVSRLNLVMLFIICSWMLGVILLVLSVFGLSLLVCEFGRWMWLLLVLIVV